MSKRTMLEEDRKLGMWLSASLDDDSVCAEMKEDVENWFDSFDNIGSKFFHNGKEFTVVSDETIGHCFGCAFYSGNKLSNVGGELCPDKPCNGVIFKEAQQ